MTWLVDLQLGGDSMCVGVKNVFSRHYEGFNFIFFFQAEDGIRDHCVTGVQTCALPIFEAIQEYEKRT